MAVLQKAIRKCKPDLEDFEPEIRLICIVTNIEERIKNAIYAISNHVKVYSYMVTLDTAGKPVMVPKLEVDNSEVEAPVRGAASEEEILKKHSHLLGLFTTLRPHLEKDGVDSYTTQNSFRFKKERLFAKLRFRKKHILLELRVGQNKVTDTDFKYWRQGESSWGYVKLQASQEIPAKVLAWIDLAIAAAAEIEDNGEDDAA